MNEQNKKVPTVRFKGFTNDWEQHKLGEVAKVTMGQSPSSKNYTDNPNDYVLVQGNADLKSNEISPRVWTKEVTKKVHKGEFIMTVRAPVGYLATANMDAVIGRGVAAIDGNKYLYYLLQTKLLDRTWEKLSSGSTFESISSNDIKNLEIKVTETEEEKLIAKLMDTVTYFVTLQQRKLDLLKQLKKGFLQKMFAEKNSKQPVLRFKGFHDDWEQRKLGDITKTNSFKPYISEAFDEGKYEVIQQGDNPIAGYANNAPFKDYKKVTLFGDHTLSLYKPQRAFLVASDGIKILSPSLKMDSLFYYYLLEKYKPHSEGYKRHFSILKKNVAFFPVNIAEQTKISHCLSNFDSLITLHQRKQNHLKLLKKSLLQQMFM